MMEILQSVTNITCETVKQNKGIKPDEVIEFVKNLFIKLQHFSNTKEGEISVEFPEPQSTKTLRISMVEE